MFDEQIRDGRISLRHACHGLSSLEILMFCTPKKALKNFNVLLINLFIIQKWGNEIGCLL
jgi:hypothetical protein